ncbi:MAG: CRTAC1 family protein, partial [Saprospiraceae bacterium]
MFINNGQAGLQNGVPTFREEAAAWGLDFEGLSVHAAFFDYDRDGDLDCYLLNNSFRSVGGYDLRPGQRDIPDPEGGNRLLRNDNKRFTDQSAQAGIYRSAIGFGLGVTVGDYNRDGWLDLFVSNDFFERDYLYRNKGDGAFEEILPAAMPEISKGSMGADMADLDNDGFPEIFVTEMTPEVERRYKTKSAFDDWNTYQNMIQTGYHRQFGRNVLQHNRRDGTFAEIGRQAGVWATDWSWGALSADFDNDGWKDIFVANGIGKDLLDQDYLNFYADPAAVSKVLRDNPGQGIRKLLDEMPSEPTPNYLFRNQGELHFDNVAARWGLDTPSFSNGAAYGDLDNDGDLDLVVNNVNMPCFVYRNETIKPGAATDNAHWLRIVFESEPGANTACLGAKVTVYAGGNQFYQELAPMRGFQSTADSRLHFGLGQVQKTDSLRVEFLSGRIWQTANQPVNQEIRIRESATTAATPGSAPPTPKPMLSPTPWQPDFQHRESNFSDFDREPLQFRMCSAEGPCLASADVNGDGLEDVYVGGAAGQPGALFRQTARGDFQRVQQADFERDKAGEDVAATFFDADGDGDLDLVVNNVTMPCFVYRTVTIKPGAAT